MGIVLDSGGGSFGRPEVWGTGCRFPGLDRTILEFLNFFQYLSNRQEFSVSGELSGLIGSGLVLRNGSDSVTLSDNGRFQFSQRLSTGDEYNVLIASQPSNPPQECQAFGGSGRIQSGNVSTVQVVCGEELVVLSGTATGLLGSGLELTNTTGSGTFPISVGGTSFAFPLRKCIRYCSKW
jgi:hypothetical protein